MAILDPYGNEVSSRTFLKSAQNGGGRMPGIPIRALEPFKKLVSQRDWQIVSYLSEKHFANCPLVEGIISQKSMFAVGNAWAPVFMGLDKEWGAMARSWLSDEWYPSCDVRGLNYDFVTNLYTISTAIDYAGDSVELLAESENGWPQIQMIPCRQIGQRETYTGKDQVIEKGPYAGAIIRNGVIMDKRGRVLAYRKLGETPADDEDIEARYVVHTFEPKWIDQSRGFPLFTSCLEDIAMSDKSEEWEQMAMLAASAISVIETNESGEAEQPSEDPLNIRTENTPAGLQIKSLLGGMIRYMRANSGNKLEQFVSAKPGDDWEKYQDRIARKVATAGNWSYAYAWKPESITTPAQRAELGKCRMSVTDRQSLLKARAKRKIGWALSVAIKNGIIPPYPGADKGGFLKWDFTTPPRITIDEGRDRAQRRADNAAGLLNDSAIVEEDGNTTYEDHCRKRWHDVAIRERTRLETEAETGIKLDPREGKMLTPNEQPEAQIEEEEAPPKKKEKTDEE